MEKNDVVEIHFDMLPRLVKANEKVAADRGRVAVERGPVVYCAEWSDNDFNVHTLLMNRPPELRVVEKPELLYGLNQIVTDAQALSYDKAGKLAVKDVKLTLIPYYAWAHRGEGDMEVWLPMEVNATSAQPQKGWNGRITDFSIINRVTLNYNVISKLPVTSRRFFLI